MPIDEHLLHAADALGMRLELVDGVVIAEAAPSLHHQRAIDRIRASIRHAAGDAGACVHLADVQHRFPDGSLKRPDIAVHASEPEATELGTVLSVPAAAIEVVSPGYEAKDYQVAAPFYLRLGVRDVLVLDLRGKHVTHYDASGWARHEAPRAFQLSCGCDVEVG